MAYRFSIDHCCFFLFSESVDFCGIWQMLDSVACCLCTDQHFHFCFYPSLFPYSPSPLQQWWSHLTVDNPRCDCWPACIIPPMDIRFKEAEIQMQVSTDELLHRVQFVPIYFVRDCLQILHSLFDLTILSHISIFWTS